jgi:F-type H+-transporting ATPase subunit b
MKKQLALFTLAAALVAGAPAVAFGFQHAGTTSKQPTMRAPTHQELATEQAETNAEEAKEASEVPKPINWFDWTNHEQPAYGAMLLNFALLMGLYYWFGKAPVAEALKNRRAGIAKEIEEAKRMRDEAEARALKYQEKLKNLEAELKDVRESLKAAGEADRDRIVREAEEKAARMEKDAKFLVDQESKQLRAELTRNAVEMALAAAEELLKKRITSADQERLAEDYLSQLTKRPSGGQEARPSLIPSGGE